MDASDHGPEGDARWEQLHLNREQTQYLECRVCGAAMTAVVSHLKFRHFRHLGERTSECPAAAESLEHQQLKAWVARRAHEAGWQVEVERSADDGSYRADVMTTNPDLSRVIVWEAQVSRLDRQTAEERTRRHVDAGHEVIWLILGAQTWSDRLPSVSIQRQEDANDYAVLKGLARLDRARPTQQYVPIASRKVSDQDHWWPTALDYMARLGGSRWPGSRAWADWPSLLGFDLPGLSAAEAMLGCLLTSIGSPVAQMRWRPASSKVGLEAFVASVLQGKAVCVPRVRGMYYAGSGDHPDFMWAHWSDVREAAGLFAVILDWELVRDDQRELCPCGDHQSRQALVHRLSRARVAVCSRPDSVCQRTLTEWDQVERNGRAAG